MEMSQRGGAESQSLLRQDRGATVMPQSTRQHNSWDGGGEGEKAPFLRNEPVKLTPAWEGTNLPNDTLNLKGITMDLVPPKDKWNLIYLTLLLHGLGTLTAWNMFINSKDYYVNYKLKNASHYSSNFLQYIGFACQIPNLIFSWLNVFLRVGGNLTTRIVWALSVEVLIFVVTVVLAMVDSDDWPVAFFWITFVLLFIMNSFNAIFQNCVYGVAARLPAQYTGAVVLGSNVCGSLVALLEWAVSSYASSPRTSAIYYFIGGMLVLLACFDTYFALPLNRFYRYHDTLQQRSLRAHPTLAATDAAARSERPRYVPYGTIMKQCWLEYYNVFITFFVTLAIFPAVHSDIKPMDELLHLGPETFTRITCFLTFNFTAMIGNITASLCPFPGPRLLTLLTTLRIPLIPLFMFCNYMPLKVTRVWPVYITSDWLYLFFAILMGWSSGHCSSLGMMYVPRRVTHENAATAGMIAAAFLVTGIVSGITFSRLSPVLVAVGSLRELF